MRMTCACPCTCPPQQLAVFSLSSLCSVSVLSLSSGCPLSVSSVSYPSSLMTDTPFSSVCSFDRCSPSLSHCLDLPLSNTAAAPMLQTVCNNERLAVVVFGVACAFDVGQGWTTHTRMLRKKKLNPHFAHLLRTKGCDFLLDGAELAVWPLHHAVLAA